MYKLAMIAIGGAFGSVLRYALGGFVQRVSGGPFPSGTLIVNLSGCLAVGFLGMILTGPVLIREEYRIGLLVGVLGGYTTFSSFGRETFLLLADGQFSLAVVNVLLSNVLGLAGVWLGHRAGQRLFGV